MPARPLFNYDKIVKAYKVFGSTRRVARLIGCSNFTVCMVARKAGLKPTASGLTEENRWHFGKSPGVVAKWSKAHPDVIMPTRPTTIEKLVECTRQDAYHYLEWRRKHFTKKVGKLPDLSSYLGEQYTISLDKKHFRLTITLLSTKRTIVLYEGELDVILSRLTTPSSEVSP